MPEQLVNGSGIEYPTLELGGKTYVIKFTRGGLLYRMSKNGADPRDLAGPKSIAAVIDILHATLFGQFDGSPEQLADIVFSEGKFQASSDAVLDAVKKVFPPTQTVAGGTADQTPAIQ